MGFIPLRQAGDNVRRAVLLTHVARSRRIPTCLVSLDIKKAFNTHSLPYLQFILQRWGFSPHFLCWVSSLHTSPSAYLKYAGYKSDHFPVSHETRQDISPVSAPLAIEPLAQLICSNPDIKGLETGGLHHKVCLFVDDIFLFLSSPLTSTPTLLSICSNF